MTGQRTEDPLAQAEEYLTELAARIEINGNTGEPSSGRIFNAGRPGLDFFHRFGPSYAALRGRPFDFDSEILARYDDQREIAFGKFRADAERLGQLSSTMTETDLDYRNSADSIFAYWHGTAAVKQAIQGIRDVVGDYPGLYTLIATWTQAIGPVSTAQSYLQKAQTDLPEAWTGTAAGEYKTYLTNLQTTSTNLSNCLSNGSNGIIEQLEGLGTAITKNYQDIIQFATDCADALIGLVDELQAAAAKTIVGVLGKDVGQVLGTNDELHKGIANINVAAQKLVVPVPGAY